MTASLPTRRLNPAEALLALRDCIVRLGVPEHEVERTIRPAASLSELAALDSELDWFLVLRYFGLWDSKWMAALPKDATVADLCVALADQVAVLAVEPVTVLGKPCLSAGAFLTICRLLANSGEDVTRLGPSTPLSDYLWRRPKVFEQTLPLMAPGRVPPLRFRNYALGRRLLGVFAAVVLAGLAYLLRQPVPAASAVLFAAALKLGVVDLLLIPLAARRRNYAVEFGGLHDFRDVVDAMLGRPLRPRAA